MDKLQKLAHELRTAIVVVDHNHKGKTLNMYDPVDDNSGHSSKTGVADAIMSLYRETDGKLGGRLVSRSCVNIPILVPPESGDNYGFLAIN